MLQTPPPPGVSKAVKSADQLVAMQRAEARQLLQQLRWQSGVMQGLREQLVSSHSHLIAAREPEEDGSPDGPPLDGYTQHGLALGAYESFDGGPLNGSSGRGSGAEPAGEGGEKAVAGVPGQTTPLEIPLRVRGIAQSVDALLGEAGGEGQASGGRDQEAAEAEETDAAAVESEASEPDALAVLSAQIQMVADLQANVGRGL